MPTAPTAPATALTATRMTPAPTSDGGPATTPTTLSPALAGGHAKALTTAPTPLAPAPAPAASPTPAPASISRPAKAQASTTASTTAPPATSTAAGLTTTPTAPAPAAPAPTVPAQAQAPAPTAAATRRAPRPRTAPGGPAGTRPRGAAGARPRTAGRGVPHALPPHTVFAERLLAVLSGERPVHWMLGHTLGEAYEQLVRLAPETPLRSLGPRPVLRRCSIQAHPAQGAVEAFATVATGARVRAMAFRLERGADHRWRCAAVELDGLGATAAHRT
ncbi:Rv3235 family protein [Streptomyces sp. NPDC093071]|uniref:Rv3235 family protein n=1 Tax=Streptomyces sp. NPDC093071 TaxID=3366022 RepID=UPI0037F8B4D5